MNTAATTPPLDPDGAALDAISRAVAKREEFVSSLAALYERNAAERGEFFVSHSPAARGQAPREVIALSETPQWEALLSEARARTVEAELARRAEITEIRASRLTKLDDLTTTMWRSMVRQAVLVGTGVLMAFALLVFLTVSPARAAGSDAPPPYAVTAAGVTLPAGVVFEAGGHVNVRIRTVTGGERRQDVHFDPNNNQPGGAFIGKAFYPVNLAPGECITWVQLSLYNEHFGEGGQSPVCRPQVTEPTPDPTPTPSVTPTPTEPTEEPTSTPPTPSPSPNPSPSSEPASVKPLAPTLTPATLAPSPSSPTPTSEPLPPSGPGLAATGFSPQGVLGSVLLILLGSGLIYVASRRG